MVGCSAYCFKTPHTLDSSVPIGVPIDNVQMYILDESMNPLPIGIKGEIYIAGDGVASGYLNDLEKTNSSFLPNHFGTGKM